MRLINGFITYTLEGQALRTTKPVQPTITAERDCSDIRTS